MIRAKQKLRPSANTRTYDLRKREKINLNNDLLITSNELVVYRDILVIFINFNFLKN